MAVVVTIVYTALLAWGFSVGARQIYQGFRKPDQLLNPLFANPIAIRIFTFHIVIVTLDLFVIGPWALAHKSELWYWGGRIALFTCSLSLAAFFNRNRETFGDLIGAWVRFRNFFEYGVHIVVAAVAVNWFSYYVLLYWLVAYRYLDVGPRRAMQSLYNTPEKLAARPWAPKANWAVITAIYVVTLVVIWNKLVLWAQPPADSVVPHVAAAWEVGFVVLANVAIAMTTWIMIRRYAATVGLAPLPVPAGQGGQSGQPGQPERSSW